MVAVPTPKKSSAARESAFEGSMLMVLPMDLMAASARRRVNPSPKQAVVVVAARMDGKAMLMSILRHEFHHHILSSSFEKIAHPFWSYEFPDIVH